MEDSSHRRQNRLLVTSSGEKVELQNDVAHRDVPEHVLYSTLLGIKMSYINTS